MSVGTNLGMMNFYCPKCLEDANINVLGMAGTADFCSMHLQNPKGASND